MTRLETYITVETHLREASLALMEVKPPHLDYDLLQQILGLARVVQNEVGKLSENGE